MSVVLIEIEHEGAFSRTVQQVNAAKVLEHPAGGGGVYRLAFLVREGGLRGLEFLPDALFQGCIDQQAHGHDHQEGHDPLGSLEIERGSQKPGIFQEAKAACRMLLPLIACQQFLRG